MASIPVAGYPSGGFGKPDRYSGRTMQIFGAEDAEKALAEVASSMPKALGAALEELGLFGERETKLRTPVQFGLLRSSIGHWEPQLASSGGSGDETPAETEARQKMERQARHGEQMAVFDLDLGKNKASVTWGTNVEYGPYIEDGFTMSTRRLVYIWNVGFRWVDPFSYRGAHMFELGLQATAKAAPPIVKHWVKEGLQAAGVM